MNSTGTALAWMTGEKSRNNSDQTSWTQTAVITIRCCCPVDAETHEDLIQDNG